MRKRAVRLQELEKSAGRDQLRLYGDLLSANLYRLEKGMTALTCEDFSLNIFPPSVGPMPHSEDYPTEYRKAANAEAVLRRLITECEEEIAYIEVGAGGAAPGHHRRRAFGDPGGAAAAGLPENADPQGPKAAAKAPGAAPCPRCGTAPAMDIPSCAGAITCKMTN